MRMGFDRGTLIVENAPPQFETLSFPGALWDPRTECFRIKPVHYHDVRKLLEKRGIPHVDEVPAFLGKPKVGGWGEIPLRPYQEAALLSWELAEKRGIAVLPTGAGKTRLALAAMAKTQMRTLCLVPTRVLLGQWVREIKKFYSDEIGIYGDGMRLIAPITVATFESAYRNMGKLGNQFELLIVDEAHHFGTGARNEILEMSIARARLGLTATPPKSDVAQINLKNLIGDTLYELSIDDLRGTYLSEFQVYSLHLNLTPSEQTEYDREIGLYRGFYGNFRKQCPEASWQDFARFAYKTTEGRNALTGFRKARRLLSFTQAKADTLGSILKRHRGSRILVFTADVATAYQISRLFLIMPLTTDIGRREREKAVSDFRSGDLKAFVTCRVLNEGFDVPEADIAIIVGGTMGEREHIQRIGRLLRPSPGKVALIYELICRRTMEVAQWKRRSQGLAPRIAA